MSEQPNATVNGAGAAENAANAVMDDLAGLRARAEKAERDRDDLRDLAQRTQADFINYQKRVQRDLADERKYAHGNLAKDLLPALDNLERATEAAKKVGETGPLVQGVAMVQSQVLEILRRHGITRIDAQGQPFDPNRHQAVMQQPTPGVPPNTVVQVLEQGFLIQDRVLRPASVVVSA